MIKRIDKKQIKLLAEKYKLSKELTELKYDIEQVKLFGIERDIKGKAERCAEIVARLKEIKEQLENDNQH